MNKAQAFFSVVWVFVTNFVAMLLVSFMISCMITTPIALVVLWIWEAVGTLPTFIASNYYPLFILYSVPATVVIMIIMLVGLAKGTTKNK